jgi:hypothetical protein
MQWWQCQVNFAVWAASAGCRVGVDHLNHSDPLIKAMYRFHFYYQTMRILVELKAPFPTDTSFDAADNPYDRRAYEGLAQDFDVDPKNQTMFRVMVPTLERAKIISISMEGVTCLPTPAGRLQNSFTAIIASLRLQPHQTGCTLTLSNRTRSGPTTGPSWSPAKQTD